MRPERRYHHRSAIAVVSRIVDVLQAGRKVDSSPHVHRVKRLENIFASVGEMSVAEQESKPSRSEIVLMIFLDGVGHKRHAGAVLLAVPPRAARNQPLVEGLIDFRIRE